MPEFFYANDFTQNYPSPQVLIFKWSLCQRLNQYLLCISNLLNCIEWLEKLMNITLGKVAGII